MGIFIKVLIFSLIAISSTSLIDVGAYLIDKREYRAGMGMVLGGVLVFLVGFFKILIPWSI